MFNRIFPSDNLAFSQIVANFAEKYGRMRINIIL